MELAKSKAEWFVRFGNCSKNCRPFGPEKSVTALSAMFAQRQANPVLTSKSPYNTSKSSIFSTPSLEFRRRECRFVWLCHCAPSQLPSCRILGTFLIYSFRMCPKTTEILAILLPLMIARCGCWEQFETPLEMATPNSVCYVWISRRWFW